MLTQRLEGQGHKFPFLAFRQIWSGYNHCLGSRRFPLRHWEGGNVAGKWDDGPRCIVQGNIGQATGPRSTIDDFVEVEFGAESCYAKLESTRIALPESDPGRLAEGISDGVFSLFC